MTKASFKRNKATFAANKLTRALLGSPFSVARRQDLNSVLTALGWDLRDCRLPPIDRNQIGLSAAPIRLQEFEQRGYNVTIDELACLARFCVTIRPKVVFELGTFDGRSTLNLSMNAPSDCTLYTLDLPSETGGLPGNATVGERFAHEPPGRVVQLFGDTRTFDFEPYAGSADLVFVDASHEYEFAANDTEVAIQLANPERSLIVWHDYIGWPGVTQAVNDLYDRGGVYLALRRVNGTSMAVLPRGLAGPGTRDLVTITG